MKAIIYNKLVRDNIPDIIKSSGQVAVTRILNDTEYYTSLVQKLSEETQEFFSSNEVEELVDIYQVIIAILESRDVSMQEFLMMCNKKAMERGGFKKRVFLSRIEYDETKGT